MGRHFVAQASWQRVQKVRAASFLISAEPASTHWIESLPVRQQVHGLPNSEMNSY
jgi:hypothetical protein